MNQDEIAAIDSPANVDQSISTANLTFLPGEGTTLPHKSPFVPFKQFMIGAPLVDDTDLQWLYTNNNFTPVATVTMGIKVLGAGITLGTFPSAQRVASTVFNANCGLLSVDISVAFTNASTDGELGIFVAKDVGATIGLGTSADVYCGGLAPLGQFSKQYGNSFSLDIAPLIKLGTSIALYAVAYGTNKNTSNMSVLAILRYASIDG